MNKKRLIIVLFFVLCLCLVIVGTISYYANSYSGNITTKANTFGFNVYKIIKTEENIFSDIDLYDTATVHSVTEGKYIVPGDYGEFTIKLDCKGSETKVKYNVVLNGENIPVNMKIYLDSEKIDKVELNPLTLNGIINLEEEKEYTIYWVWPYDSGENNDLDIEYQGKTFSIGVEISGIQALETDYAITYIGFDNSVQYPSIISKDSSLSIDMSDYNYTSLNLKQGSNNLSLDTHYTYENGILTLFNIIDDVTITNQTSFCSKYKEITTLGECLIATDYLNYRKDRNLENARKNIENKVADFTKTEPYLSYSENVSLNITNNYNTGYSSSLLFYYTTTIPTFNTANGYHEFTNETSGTIEDIKNNNGYTCLYTWHALSCLTMYKINSYIEENNKIVITDYDKYTYTLNDGYSSKAGLYAIADDDTSKENQKSYYFRGEVNNNWVSFGGFYWRILRINGDGSIRMIYSGTKDNHSESGTVISNSKFNSNYQGTTYLGYMYNDDDLVVSEYPSETPTNLSGYIEYVYINELTNYYFTSEKPTCSLTDKTCSFTCKIGENCIYTTWPELNTNYDKNDSTSTSTIWKYTSDYKYTCFSYASVFNNSDGSKTINCMLTEEIMGVVGNSNGPRDTQARIKYYGLSSPSYESAVTNKTDSEIKKVIDSWYQTNIYDNNLESYLVNQVFCNDRNISDKNWSIGDGYSWDKTTIYNPYYRLFSSKNPSLICQNQNDKFTLKVDSLSSIKGTDNYGNNALNYPVGLITGDEVALAGGLYNTMNSKYYLYNGIHQWTVSPEDASSEYARSAGLEIGENGNLTHVNLRTALGVRPVINLKSDIFITGGSGTESDPYVIE